MCIGLQLEGKLQEAGMQNCNHQMPVSFAGVVRNERLHETNPFRMLQSDESAKVSTNRNPFNNTNNPNAGRNQSRTHPKPELVIIGDSMARGISSKMSDSLAFINSGAGAEHIQPKVENQVKSNPDYVLIQSGTNNLDQEVRLSIPALASVIDKTLSSCSAKVLVNAVPYQIHNSRRNKLASSLNVFLKGKCQKNPRLHFINCNPNLDSVFYQRDGIHFSEAGKKVYASQLTSNINQIKNFSTLPPRRSH